MKKAIASLLAMGLLADFAFAQGEASATGKAPDMPAKLVQTRNGLGNVLQKLEAGKPVTIVYFGTSITAPDGWRKQNTDWFKATYPKADIKGINAAIGATGSALGVYRVRDHVLKHKPDLVFVEFSINDGGSRVSRDVEGIVRQIWKEDPCIDICLVHMIRPNYMTSNLKAGKCTTTQWSHEVIADHYGIPSINAALRVTELVDAGKLLMFVPKDADGKPQTATTVMGVYTIDGLHPGNDGVKVIADAAAESLTAIFAASKPGAHPLKSLYIPGNTMENARMLPLDQKMVSSGWVKLPEDSRFGGKFAQAPYKMSGVWEAHQPGESIKFRFKGTQVEFYDLRAPDAGQVTVMIDGKEMKSPEGIIGFSRCHSNFWPCNMILASDLEDKEHTVEVKISAQPPTERSALVAAESKAPGFDPKKYEGTFIRVARILVVGDVIAP